jgi:hypothetical protein
MLSGDMMGNQHFVPSAVGTSREAVDRLRAEREWNAKAQPVVIIGVSIPFWRLVWWLVGVMAAISLIDGLFDLIVRSLVALYTNTRIGS